MMDANRPTPYPIILGLLAERVRVHDDRYSITTWMDDHQSLYEARKSTVAHLCELVERVASGDILFKAQVGWQGDAFPNDHPATLDALKKLDIELLMPGHGDHIAGRANIDASIATMQDYLREEWKQVSDAKGQKLSPEDALKKMDLSKFRDTYGNGVAPSLAAGQAMPFAKADLTVDSVPTAVEIDRALTKLETIARERGIAVGVASALPISIDRIAVWSKALEGRGIMLVPLTTAMLKSKSS